MHWIDIYNTAQPVFTLPSGGSGIRVESMMLLLLGVDLPVLPYPFNWQDMAHRVIVFEKEQYPFHKVCGEYISLESWDFLNSLGLDLEKMNLPIITQLQVSAVKWKTIGTKITVGRFWHQPLYT